VSWHKCSVPASPGKSWKVPDFISKISRTWKVLENEFGTGKSWKLNFEVMESRGICLVHINNCS